MHTRELLDGQHITLGTFGLRFRLYLTRNLTYDTVPFLGCPRQNYYE
jgi:hypothetical protein